MSTKQQRPNPMPRIQYETSSGYQVEAYREGYDGAQPVGIGCTRREAREMLIDIEGDYYAEEQS